MFFKFATATVLGHSSVDPNRKTAGKNKLGSFEFEPRVDGHKYLYAAIRACTADVPNLNYDMLPSWELDTAYKTFIGSYIYLNHDNQDPAKARGAIIDAVYHDEDPDDKWIEILEEIDEEFCPKLCSLIRSGEIDTVSMGCSIESSTCSVCGNVAEYPWDYCEHIQQKGRVYNGKLAYEICNGIEFFECSWVYDPADPTATVQALNKEAKVAHIIPTASYRDVDIIWYFDIDIYSFYPSYPSDGWNDPGTGFELDGEFSVDFYVDDKLMCNCSVSGGNIDIYEPANESEAYEPIEKYLDDLAYAFISNAEFPMTADTLRRDALKFFDWIDIEPGFDFSVLDDSVVESAKDSDDYVDSYANNPRYPDEIDGIEEEKSCPLCGSASFDGECCGTCGYIEPPNDFGDILLEKKDDYEEFDEDERDDGDDVDYRHAFVPVF